MSITALLLLALVADGDSKKTPPAAKVTVTAETACTHCTFGFGESCALCLKLDESTPIILEGKAAEECFESRLSGTLLVVEGALSVNADKRMVLRVAKARPYSDKDKAKAPDKGQARVEGTVYSEKGTLAIRNGDHAILLHGKQPEAGKAAALDGELSLDKAGKIQLEAKK